jgi:hypothetical protein
MIIGADAQPRSFPKIFMPNGARRAPRCRGMRAQATAEPARQPRDQLTDHDPSAPVIRRRTCRAVYLLSEQA